MNFMFILSPTDFFFGIEKRSQSRSYEFFCPSSWAGLLILLFLRRRKRKLYPSTASFDNRRFLQFRKIDAATIAAAPNAVKDATERSVKYFKCSNLFFHCSLTRFMFHSRSYISRYFFYNSKKGDEIKMNTSEHI